MDLPIPNILYKGLPQYVVFSDCLLLLSIMLSKFILTVPPIIISILFMAEEYSTLWVDHNYSYSSFDIYLDYFHFWIWTFMYKYFCEHMFSFILGI